MKSLIYPFLLALILGFNCLAADPPCTNSAGEVIFYTQTAYEDPIIVSCSLAGVLFDQDATWNATVPGGHPQYDEYLHYGTNNENNMLVGSTNALTHGNGMICWESVFENDDPASSQVCTGMIGWGRYVFAVGNENEDPEIVFTLNTIDGRWMYSTFSDKFIFKVERTPQISVSVYNWVMARWDEVTFGTNVNYWENNATGSRYRAGLDPNSTEPFALSISQGYPVACNFAVLDVPLECSQNLSISPGKTLEIHDYYDDQLGGEQSTVVRFEPGTGVVIGFENNPNVITTFNVVGHYDPANYLGSVILASSDFTGTPDANDVQWKGIEAKGWRESTATPSSFSLNLQHCAIVNAENGIVASLQDRNDIEHYLEANYCRILYANWGVQTKNTALYLRNSLIDQSRFKGVEYSGYTFDMTCPNRIENCGIYYSRLYGIQVNGHAKFFGTTLEPNSLEITSNYISSSGRHGLYIYESSVGVKGNTLIDNGKTNGVETPPYGYCGTLVDASWVAFHGNQVQSNSAYGLQADNASVVHGNFRDFGPEGGFGEISDQNELLYGNNCFHANDYNVGTSNNSNPFPKRFEPRSTVMLGQPITLTDPLVPFYLSSRNSFSTPSKTLPNSSHYGQMTAEQSSVIWVYNNYWGNTRGGTVTAVQQVTNAKIHSDFTSIADDACYRWAPQPPSGGASAISYSDAAGMILNRVVLGFGDSAVNLTYDNIDNSMDSVELGIRMLALRSAYVFDRNAVARDTLRKYAFKPFNPGVPVDFITNTAIVNLVMAEVLLDNVEGALQAIDSVLYRSVPNEMKVHYLAKRAEIFVNDVGDSSYIAVIDSLLYLDPTNNDLLTAKYMVSGDTAYTVWYEKRGADYTSAPSPETSEIHSYPTPAMSEQTVWMDNPGEVSNVVLYDYLGREIDKSRYEYSQAGESISFVYRLDNGVYLQVIVTDKGTRVNRIVVNTAGVHR